MKTEEPAAPAAGAPPCAPPVPYDHTEANAALLDAIAMQVALHGRRPTVALLRALCDCLEAHHG